MFLRKGKYALDVIKNQVVMKISVLLVISFFIFSHAIHSQEVNFNMDQKSWEEDFEYLKKKVEKIVPQYKNTKYKADFDAVYDIISTSEVGNKKEAIVFALQRLLNTLNDEGCNVPLFQRGLELKLLPIKTYWFNDGLFVLDAIDSHNDVIGAQITKINDTDVEDVFNALKPFLNADNDYYKRYLFQAYGLMPSLLKIANLGTSNDEVVLQFASGKTKRIKSRAIKDYAELSRKLPNDEFFSFSNTSHEGENYWFEFLPNSKSLFIQLQQISNNENGASFSSFVNRIEKILEKNKANNLIIDVRYGGGGNGFKLKSLTDLLRDSKRINKKGHLFVLTSKATRGTLLELTSILDLNTKAVIVGEPTAEGANTVGDIKYITLPNSGLIVSLTHTLWATSWNQDTSSHVMPDEEVIFNYQDRNDDPWLKKVHTYQLLKSYQPIPNQLIEALPGTYKIEGRKVKIENKNGTLFLTMSRRMKSFFELHTQLYYLKEGILATDINDVFVQYKYDELGQLNLKELQWKGKSIKIQ